MTGDESDAAYYRRRAAICDASAESAAGDREREIHAELSKLYYDRAERLEPTMIGGRSAPPVAQVPDFVAEAAGL